LDRETLSICVRLLEAGVSPEALVAAIRELQDVANQRQQQQATNGSGDS